MKFDMSKNSEAVKKLMRAQSRRHKLIWKLTKFTKWLVIAMVLTFIMFALLALINAIMAPTMLLTLTIWLLPFIVAGIAVFPILGVLVWNSYLEGEAEKIRMEFKAKAK
jgi:fatty acid desaturase